MDSGLGGTFWTVGKLYSALYHGNPCRYIIYKCRRDADDVERYLVVSTVVSATQRQCYLQIVTFIRVRTFIRILRDTSKLVRVRCVQALVQRVSETVYKYYICDIVLLCVGSVRCAHGTNVDSIVTLVSEHEFSIQGPPRGHRFDPH